MCCALGMKPWHLDEYLHNLHGFYKDPDHRLERIVYDEDEYFPNKRIQKTMKSNQIYPLFWLKLKRRSHSQRERCLLDSGH